MFKNYLRIQTPAIQLSILLFLWAAFFLMFSYIQIFYLQSLFGITAQQLADLPESELLSNPQKIIYLNALGAVFLFMIPALIFSYLAHPQPISYLGMAKKPFSKQIFWVFIIALGLIPVLSSLGGFLETLNLGEAAKRLKEEREAAFSVYFKSGNILSLLRNLFFLALIPAVSEELLFRGILQKFAYSFFKKPWIAIVISGFIFALFHFSVYEFLPIFLAGILLAWVYYITSSLWLCIWLHFLNNGLQVIFIYFTSENESFNNLDQEGLALIGLATFGLIILFFSIKKLHKHQSPLPVDWGVMEKEIEGNKHI